MRLCASSLRAIALLALAIAANGAMAAIARAEFRICNKTPGRIGLVIGVKDGPIHITQGWFNLKPNACETPIREDLKDGPYYIYGVDYDRGGEWTGPELLCVGDREFYVEGSTDCYARGYDRAGFRRIDTNRQKSWTLNIIDEQPSIPTGGQPPRATDAPTNPTNESLPTKPLPKPPTKANGAPSPG